MRVGETGQHALGEVPRRGRDDKIVQVMDPVHNFIDISEYPVVRELIDAPHFQRLRRLHQLGLASAVYPNATHSRFAHSIGVMHTFLVLFDSVAKNSGLEAGRSEGLRPVGAVAALLHDVGHGPFSHASEKFLHGGRFNHEDMAQDIIRSRPVRDILQGNRIDPQLICDILAHKVPKDMLFVSQLISSQLDADRLDYLMRDALFTGVSYGKIDVRRIANSLSIWGSPEPKPSLEGTIVVSKKGVEAVEDYLLGRHHMYRRVYHHKTIRCMENMLINTFRLASALPHAHPMREYMAKKITPEMMLSLDDYACHSAICGWRGSQHKILSDLSGRLIERRLLKARLSAKDTMIRLGLNKMDSIRGAFKRRGLDFDHYFIQDSEEKSGYDPYTATSLDDEQTATSHIMVNAGGGDLKEISEVSVLVRTMSAARDDSVRIFYPEDLSGEIGGILGR